MPNASADLFNIIMARFVLVFIYRKKKQLILTTAVKYTLELLILKMKTNKCFVLDIFTTIELPCTFFFSFLFLTFFFQQKNFWFRTN